MLVVRSFLVTAAVCLLPATLRAQRATPVADSASLSTYTIPVQALPAALAQYSLQSGLRVRFTDDLDAIRTVLLTGRYTGSAALRAMLAGTGLRVRFTSASQAEVYAPGEMPVYALPPMSVTAERGRTYVTHSTRSAMKTDKPLRDTPQSVSIVTSDAIRDQGMQGMADVVSYLPGVQMGQGEGHRDAPTIRGNSSTADFFVDGVRDDAQYFRDLYNVERVEALKGANALIFGRGGAGGVINRVTKQPQERAVRDAAISAGSFNHRRITADLGDVLPMLTDRTGVGAVGAWRVNGMYENSGGFRQDAYLERFGINPSVSFTSGERTRLLLAYERFGDDRTVDRGVPSFQGHPFAAPIITFFGNADSSYATMRVNGLSALVERRVATSVKLRNRFQATSYDKFYQNSFANGTVNTAGTQVNLAAYNNSTDRRNIIDQMEATFELTTGGLRHTALAGVEGAHQHTSNFRNTGYYDNTTTSLTVDASTPATARPITFRQSSTDADNETTALVAALYVQDEVTISDMVQAVAGVRVENFDIGFTNRRTNEKLSRTDRMVSPRAGLILKPLPAASLYGSYSVSHLPSSGDQFSSLTVTTQTLEPERITNYEVGAKWDARPGLSLTAAVYRLERTNTTAPDLVDAARTVQTGAQRTSGYELGAAGAVTSWWQVTGGAAFQRARITSTTRAAPAGAAVPLVPERTASLWNRWQVSHRLGIGAGVVHRSDMYAAIDNTVKLPGYTRADAAFYVRAASRVRLQLNVENVLNTRYYATSHGNNNIMPGSPRSLRITLETQR